MLTLLTPWLPAFFISVILCTETCSEALKPATGIASLCCRRVVKRFHVQKPWIMTKYPRREAGRREREKYKEREKCSGESLDRAQKYQPDPT